MNLSQYIWIFLLLVTHDSFTYSFDCFTQQDDYKCKLSTTTPYRFIANYDDSPLHYPGCTAKKIWLIIRHGTRYPGKKDIPAMLKKLPSMKQKILENYALNKTSLTPEDILLLENWELNFNEDDTTKLTAEGEYELTDLAERYQSRFPSILPDVYDNRTYKFKYTATQRAEESAKHFAAGLFGWHFAKNISYPVPEAQDPILRFYKRCPRWKEEVDKNPLAYKEKELFVKSQIFTDMLNNISKRIDYQIDYDTARMIYKICGFDTAYNPDAESPWCKILTLSDFKINEFAEDLRYYWIDGYGYRLTYEHSCPALKDMFDFFASSSEQLTTAYFTHSGTILKLLALIGVAKDPVPLTHDLYATLADSRAWRTSIIDACATNIAFVLYDCVDVGPSILFMHQERPVYLSGCPKDAPCPMSIMKDMYPDRSDECQFEAICRRN